MEQEKSENERAMKTNNSSGSKQQLKVCHSNTDVITTVKMYTRWR